MGFFADNALRKLNVDDVVATTVVNLPSGAAPRGATWGSDDSIVFALEGSALQTVSAAGGSATSITTLDTQRGEDDHRWPAFLPGSRAVLYTIWKSAGESELAVHSFDMGESKILGTGTYPRYVETGHLLFARPRLDGVEEGAIWAVPFDAGRLEITGEPRPVIDSVHLHLYGAAQVAVADDGSLAYVDGALYRQQRVTPAWIDRAGGETALAGLVPGRYESPQMSPDGAAVTFLRDGDIWVYDVERSTETRLTNDPAFNLGPRWTPDGSHIVFGASSAPGALFWQTADGSSRTERVELGLGSSPIVPLDVTPDGTQVVFRIGDQSGVAALPGRGEETVTFLPELADSATVSPDGRWLAYASRRSGRSEVYVERFPMQGDRQTLSIDGGASPVWSPDGDTLFYMNLEGTQIMSVPVRTQSGLVAESSEPVVTGLYTRPTSTANRNYFDVSPRDGRFIVLPRPTTSDTVVPITVVLNWHEELLARVPTN